MTTTAPLPTQAFLDGAADVNQPARYKLIAEIVKNCETVLDVGCGDGLLRKFVALNNYLGIDPDAAAIEKARATYSPIDFVCANSEAWQHTYDFDAVILNEVLYYMNAPLKTLQKWRMCVKPSGLLLISIYNRPARWWQNNPNMKALKIARKFAKQFPHEEHPVEQNDKKWSVLVIHC